LTRARTASASLPRAITVRCIDKISYCRLDRSAIHGGQDIGEWIVIEFDGPRMVKQIQIENGYNKDPNLYQKNSRVKEIKVEFSKRASGGRQRGRR
jgi:hypothetical protein